MVRGKTIRQGVAFVMLLYSAGCAGKAADSGDRAGKGVGGGGVDPGLGGGSRTGTGGGGMAGAGAAGAGAAGAGAGSGAPGEGGGNTAGWPVPADDPQSEAVAYQIDSRHSGSQPGDTLRLPLQARWEHAFASRYGSDDTGYAVVARGRVFVADGAPNGTVSVVALSSATGELLWSAPPIRSQNPRANLAYADERVFATNLNGTIVAYAAADGSVLWTTELEDHDVRSPPTVAGRIVYVVDMATLYAFSGATGQILWSAETGECAGCTPTVADGVVYIDSYGVISAFDALTGRLRWQHTEPTLDVGSGSVIGDFTIAMSGTSLFVRGRHANRIFSNTGEDTGELFQANPAPALTADWIFAADGRSIYGTPRTGGAQSFRYYDDTQFNVAPLAVGDKIVFLGESGGLYVADQSGHVVSSAAAGYAYPTQDPVADGVPISGLAAAENQLFVAMVGGLVVY